MKLQQTHWKFRKYKQQKSVLRINFFRKIVLVLILSIEILYVILFFSFFQIQQIQITGNKKTLYDDIQNFVSNGISKKIFFWETKSIFLVNLKTLKRALLTQFPQIDKINLNKKFPNVLQMQIQERQAVGEWCEEKIKKQTSNIKNMLFQDISRSEVNPNIMVENLILEDCYLIDKNGIIFKEINREIFQKNLVLIKNRNNTDFTVLGKKVIEQEILNQILKIKKETEKILNNTTDSKQTAIVIVKEFIILPEKIVAQVSDGWEIYFNLSTDIDSALIKLNLLLEKIILVDQRKNLEYIDLRFTKAYFKYKD